MRTIRSALALATALPLAACYPQLATVDQAPKVAVAPEIPRGLIGMERDREWMKLTRKTVLKPELERATVDYETKEKPGTIIVSTQERRLYYVLPEGKAERFPVSVGVEGRSWTGTAEINRKVEWPDWRPPAEMLVRKPELPNYMEGSPLSPMGARALYLAQNHKDTLFRIHGTNEPEFIGEPVSSGCIRMFNEDVVDLYERVKVGAKVVVI